MTITTSSIPPRRIATSESLVRRVAVKAFYALLNSDSHVQIPENAGDFRLLSPRAAKALRQMPERNRFFKGLASWIGFRQKRIDYEPAQRARRPKHLGTALADRAVAQRPDGVFGGAAAHGDRARFICSR